MARLRDHSPVLQLTSSQPLSGVTGSILAIVAKEEKKKSELVFNCANNGGINLASRCVLLLLEKSLALAGAHANDSSGMSEPPSAQEVCTPH